MPNKFKRHPVKHFFIMGRVQKKIIGRMMVIMGTVSLITLAMVVAVYYLKYQSGYFYFMTESLDANLVRHSIWSLILPSIGPSILASLLVGAYVSLSASRKIALPLFKIKQWATSMFAGNLDYQVTLRDGDDLFELETSCHQVSRKYNEIFSEIKLVLEDEKTTPESKVSAMQDYISQFKII